MVENQTTIFEMLYPSFKINKPIRLIELFAGYGSQALALKYLGVEFEHWRICEWAVRSIQAYKDIHFSDMNYDFCGNLTKDNLVKVLYELGISSNYNEPMTKQQIERLSETQLKTIWNNILITKNLVNIQQVKGSDLCIKDTDKFTYLLTYSFPCQDLSLAGLGKGMSDTSTRSGMLWEVERILTELEEKPQVLLMENVPQVHGEGNVEDFNKWQLRLEELGYKNYWQDLIATDYGIPQTRNRTFMVSILGDYNYTFPKPIPLKLKLKDMLEENVDEKYYLSDKTIQFFLHNEEQQRENGNGFRFNVTEGNNIAKTITTRAGSRMDDNFISNKSLQETLEQNDIKDTCYIDTYNKRIDEENSGTITTGVSFRNNTFLAIKNATNKGYLEAREGDGVNISSRMEYQRGNVQKDKTQTLSCMGGENNGVVVNMKTKLCNDLIEQGKVKENDVIRHSYTRERNEKWDKRNVEQNNLSPTLDTRCDCLGVCIKGIATNESKEWQKEPLEEKCRTILANKSNGGVGLIDTNLRIRKLTPRECFRLMGVKDDDFDKVRKNQSDSSLYHLAGDSIVVNVLMAILGEMIDDNKRLDE